MCKSSEEDRAWGPYSALLHNAPGKTVAEAQATQQAPQRRQQEAVAMPG